MPEGCREHGDAERQAVGFSRGSGGLVPIQVIAKSAADRGMGSLCGSELARRDKQAEEEG